MVVRGLDLVGEGATRQVVDDAVVAWTVVLGRAAQAALYGSRSVVLGPAICSSSNVDYGEEGKEQAGAMGRKGKSRAEPWEGREGEQQGGAMGKEGEKQGQRRRRESVEKKGRESNRVSRSECLPRPSSTCRWDDTERSCD